MIRTKDGLLLMEIGNTFANAIIQQCPGFFRIWRGDKSGKTCFEITEDMKATEHTIKIHLWKGYVLIPK
jgi:hypothetical protein